jgi:probable rRNA maturation factor
MPEIDLDIVFHINHLTEAQQSDQSKRFEAAAKWVTQRFHLQRLTVSISIVDDPTIHRLNRDHLQHDWPTDVISFVFQSGAVTEGEIIASWDTAQRLSQAAGWSPVDELLLYILHGLLHLAGLDDVEPEQQQEIRSVENEYLNYAGVPGAQNYLARFNDVSY